MTQTSQTPDENPAPLLLDVFSIAVVVALATLAYAVWRYGPSGIG